MVASRHRQVDARNRAAIAIAVAHHDVEAVTVGARRHIGPTHVGLGREAIGDDAAVADARNDRLPLGVIETEHRGALKGTILDELHDGDRKSTRLNSSHYCATLMPPT